MIKIDILAFGIAKDILQTQNFAIEIASNTTIAQLKEQLCKQYPDFEKLRCLSIAVNAEYQEDDFVLSEKDEIAIIPPVSGG